MFQQEEFNELLNKYRENKLAHAYLIETNNDSMLMKDLKKFICHLNCPEKYQETCNHCNICNLIAKDNLPSLKIIEPDGAGIKKNQIEELKEAFSKKPIYSKYNIYIIKNADKLNSSSANSMLKFLEEPTEGIIGFFLTSNKDVMMDTIKSRCQSLVINYEMDKFYATLNLSEDEYNNYGTFIKNYLQKVMSKELINNKNEFLSIYSERKEILNIFQIIFQIYYQNFLRKIELEYDLEIVNLYEVSDSQTEIIKKLNIITTTIHNLGYNVNMEQALDKFVIEMRDSNE